MKNTHLYARVTSSLLVIFTILTIASYISYLFGNEYFMIQDSDKEISYWLEYIVSLALFITNMIFVFGISLSLFDKRLIAVTVGYIPVYVIAKIILGDGLAFTSVVPLLYCIGVCLYINKLSLRKAVRTVISYVALAVAIFTYQWLSIQYKLNYVGFLDNSLYIDLYELVYYSVDMILLLALLYSIGGVHYGRRKLVVDSINRSDAELGNEDCRLSESDRKAIELYESKSIFDKICIGVALVFIQLVQLFCVFSFSIVGNTVIEVSLILVSFWICRSIFKKCFHFDAVKWCTLCSVFLFYGGSRITISFQHSQFCSILIGALIALSLYEAKIYKDKYDNDMKELDSFKQDELSFEPDAVSEDVLRNRCCLLKFSAEETDIAVDYFYNKKSHKDMAEALTMCVNSSKQKKNRMKKLLTAKTRSQNK